MSALKQARPGRVQVRFPDGNAFRRDVQDRVNDYLLQNGLKSRSLGAMYRKTAIVLTWWAVSYALILFGGLPLWVTALLCVSFAAATAGIGFNVMHDANHDAYTTDSKLNRLLGLSVELVGISSFVWRQQHNVWHHTYTNVSGLDEGLEASGAMRWSPHDPWHRIYAVQHLYWPVIYGLSALSLMTLHNFRVFLTGRSGPTFVYPRMSVRARLLFLAGRALNVAIYIGIPLLFFSWLEVLAGFAIAAVTAGLIMATILQLSHVMQVVEFPEPSGDPMKIEGEWAVHQVMATIDFGPQNRFLTWYVGGLNFQIEHHLFPRMCHVHYPKIAPIVRQACADHGVPYRVYPGFAAALAAHVQSLRWLGSRESSAPQTVVTRLEAPAQT